MPFSAHLARYRINSLVNLVIHVSLFANIDNELPLLLKNQLPEKPSSNLGSGNWAVPPAAIVFGGAYDDETIDRLQKLIANTDGAREIPWLRVDSTKPRSAVPGSPEYASLICQQTKDLLAAFRSQDRLGDKWTGGIVLF